jgi:hypothetical protein
MNRLPLGPAFAPHERVRREHTAAQRCAQLLLAPRQSLTVGGEPVKICFSFGGIGQSGLQQPESLIMPAFAIPAVRKSVRSRFPAWLVANTT